MSGVLYNWYVISPENLKKLAPAGWHIPTDAEWDTLQNYMIANGYNYNSTTTGNNIAKSMAAKTDWAPTNLPTGAIGKDLAINNKSGFSAFPGGYRRSSGMFSDVQYRGGWWSATENGSVAYIRFLYYTNVNLARDYTSKVCGCSIRLVKD
jgi:uncharacterized protein (TIGR02145 family)